MRSILLADDSTFMRNWIKNLVEQDKECKVIAEARDGEDAIRKYITYKPDIVVLDITMKHVDGLMALEEILKIDPNAKIMMCSAISTQQNVIEAIKLGAKDFVVKPYFNEIVSKIKGIEL